MTQLLSNERVSNNYEESSIDLEDDADKVKIKVMPGAAGLFNVARWRDSKIKILKVLSDVNV